MTLAEKHKIKAEEKKLEKEEARAAFRLNQIKPTTNACFNILFVLLSFTCLFPFSLVYNFAIHEDAVADRAAKVACLVQVLMSASCLFQAFLSNVEELRY